MRTNTISFWSHILANVPEYTNPFYIPSIGILEPDTSMCALRVWNEYYTRWTSKRKTALTTTIRGAMMQASLKAAEERIKNLEEKIRLLEEGKKGITPENSVETKESVKELPSEEVVSEKQTGWKTASIRRNPKDLNQQ